MSSVYNDILLLCAVGLRKQPILPFSRHLHAHISCLLWHRWAWGFTFGRFNYLACVTRNSRR